MNEIDLRNLARFDMVVPRGGHWQELELSDNGQFVSFDELRQVLENQGFRVVCENGVS